MDSFFQLPLLRVKILEGGGRESCNSVGPGGSLRQEGPCGWQPEAGVGGRDAGDGGRGTSEHPFLLTQLQQCC